MCVVSIRVWRACLHLAGEDSGGRRDPRRERIDHDASPLSAADRPADSIDSTATISSSGPELSLGHGLSCRRPRATGQRVPLHIREGGVSRWTVVVHFLLAPTYC